MRWFAESGVTFERFYLNLTIKTGLEASIVTGRKDPKFPLRNVGGSIQKTASTLFSSDWDGKPHGVGCLAAGADMNKGGN